MEQESSSIQTYNLYWQTLYASWYSQRKLLSWKYKTLQPIIKNQSIPSIDPPLDDRIRLIKQIDHVTRALVNHNYLISGHESGAICQWEITTNRTPFEPEITKCHDDPSHVTKTKCTAILVKHQSGAIRDMIILNPFIFDHHAHAPEPLILVSIAQDNIIKVCSTVDLERVDSIQAFTLTHPFGSVEGQAPFMTTLCLLGPCQAPPFLPLYYFCVGFRNGFLSIWEQPQFRPKSRSPLSNNTSLNSLIGPTELAPARMERFLRAHGSEIVHTAYWNGTLATASVSLELKLWSLTFGEDLYTSSSNYALTGFECYHSLTMGFHSYQQSLPFGACYYAAPWNFAFKSNSVLAANLKLLVSVSVIAAPKSTQTMQTQYNQATQISQMSLQDQNETGIAYRQFRAASKLPYNVQNDTIVTLTLKGSLLCLATSGGWVLLYYLEDTERNLREWDIKEPCFAKKLNFREEFKSIPLETMEKHGAIYITGMDISLFDSNYVLLSLTTPLGVIIYKFSCKS
ncbi:unnamed protein product [Gordionus sp. m RMFG-2023]